LKSRTGDECEQAPVQRGAAGETLELDVDPLAHRAGAGNLLTNAAKYTPPEGKIRSRRSARQSGAGARHRQWHRLAPADLPRIFEMFTQVTPSADRPSAGSVSGSRCQGVGRAARRFDRSEERGPGKGSEFIVRLNLS
jgi:signal transduction histidine kinase